MEKVKPLISKQDTIKRSAISAHDKLWTTMRFLASEASEKDLIDSFHLSTASIWNDVPKDVRQSMMSYMKISSPSSTTQWQQLAARFEIKWPLYTASLLVKWVHFSLPPQSHQIIFSEITRDTWVTSQPRPPRCVLVSSQFSSFSSWPEDVSKKAFFKIIIN